MATYYVDDGGSATDPYDTWAKAATSLSQLDDAKALASGDIIYIGHNHVCQYTHAANRTITGPTSGAPVYIISATQGSSPPTYASSTTNQIDTTEGAYSLTFDGSFALYGVKMTSGGSIVLDNDSNEVGHYERCTFKLPANGRILSSTSTNTVTRTVNCTVDLGSDASSNRSQPVFESQGGNNLLEAVGLSFVTAEWRTGSVFAAYNVMASACDFSGFTNATPCELVSGTAIVSFLQNCKTHSTFVMYSGNPTNLLGSVTAVNIDDNADVPQYLANVAFAGGATNSTVTRTGGATVESTATSWLVTTAAAATEAFPYRTPWVYGVVSSTGSKTFTVYIGNNTADLTDAECWLEVESMGDAGGSPLSELTTDQRTITTTAANQTDDTTSTWSSAQTYMQSLAVTATVDQAGLFRARVAVAKASVTNLYVDPKVTVS